MFSGGVWKNVRVLRVPSVGCVTLSVANVLDSAMEVSDIMAMLLPTIVKFALEL